MVLTDIYAAGEDPLPGASLDTLADAIRRDLPGRVDVARTLDDVVDAVVRIVRAGDVVITLGAGSIGTIPDRLVVALERSAPLPETAS